MRAKIDHRTPDVVEVLGEDEYTALTLLRYLPVLDVVSTAPLRDAAQKGCTANSRKSIAPEDDPRPYQELLLRLGDGVQFPALKWLPEHACGAETELGEADTLLFTRLLVVSRDLGRQKEVDCSWATWGTHMSAAHESIRALLAAQRALSERLLADRLRRGVAH